jgi:hypothetical protein
VTIAVGASFDGKRSRKKASKVTTEATEKAPRAQTRLKTRRGAFAKASFDILFAAAA